MGKYIQGIDKIIVEKVDIVDFLSRYMKLKKSGKNYKGLCPFHNEKTPSFFVSAEEKLYNCFGCEAGGNIINFVSAIENLDFIDTLEFIAESENIDLDQYLEKSNEKNDYYKKRNKILKVNREAAIYFYKILRKDSKALEYLKKRKIDKYIIKTFGLGYSLDKWEGLLKYLINKGYSKKFLYDNGLLSKSNDKYYDKFRNRIIFPIFDVKGKVIAFGGRIIEKNKKAPKYLNSPETDVFNKSKVLYGLNIARKFIRKSNFLILVEGYMDVIMLHKFGIKNAIATLGTSFTEKHARIVKKYVGELIICFDSDEAGFKATKRAIKKSTGIINKVRVVNLPSTMDPDDYINKFGKEKFIQLVHEAKTSHQFLLDSLEEKLNLEEEYDLKEYMQQAKIILSDIKEYSIKNYYAQMISEKINLPSKYVLKELFNNLNDSNNLENKTQRSKIKRNKKLNKKSKLQIIEEKLLQYALRDRKYFDKIYSLIDIENINTLFIKSIFYYLEKIYSNKNVFNIDLAKENLTLKESLLCENLINSFTVEYSADKDIKIYCKKFEIELLQNQLKEIRYSREKSFNSSEIENLIIKEEQIKKIIKEKTSKLNK